MKDFIIVNHERQSITVDKAIADRMKLREYQEITSTQFNEIVRAHYEQCKFLAAAERIWKEMGDE